MQSTKLNYVLGFIFTICLLLFFTAGIFFNHSIDITEIHSLIIYGACCVIPKDTIQKIMILCGGLTLIAIELLFSFGDIYLFGTQILLMSALFFFSKDKKVTLPYFIIGLSFLLHLFYIQHTDIDTRQHDIRGIIYYMNEIVKDGFNFFNFNPWDMYYAFHQPLYFWIIGQINVAEIMLFGSHLVALEGLQYVSLFLVTATIVYAFAILKLLKFDCKIISIILTFIAFNPTLVLFSGYISDDTMVLFWSVFTIYHFLCWYCDENFSHIILSALGFGLGVLTKLSLLMITPAFAVLLFLKLIQSNDKTKAWIDIFTFICIAVPLGLFWILRNHILFDMQFFNVPDTSPNGQNFFHLSFVERFFDFSMIFTPFINAPEIVDGNMWLALIKTELFGEWNLSLINPYIIIPATCLYVLNICIKLSVLFGILFYLFRNPLKQGEVWIFFVLQYLIIWGYSFIYALDYPYICSSDYRLFAQLILPEFILLSSLYQKETAKNIFSVVSFIYGVSVATIYVMIC